MPQRQAIGDNLYAPLVRDRHIEVHVRKPDVSGDLHDRPARRHAQGAAWGQRTRGQDPRGGAGRAVVTERVKLPVAAASARREREGKSQAAQQQNPVLRTGDGELVASGKDIQGTGGKGLGLR